MALILTFQEGEGFYVGDRRWFVESFDDAGIWLIGPPVSGSAPQRIRITEKEAVEIEPNVLVSEGFIPEMGCRLVLEAPREIAILRDELYRRGGQGSRDARNDLGPKP